MKEKACIISLSFNLSHILTFNLLTPGAFGRKTHFLDVFAFFRLDFSQISFKLVANASAT